MPDPTSLVESVSTSFLELSSVANTLNQVSDALGKAISEIDEGLKKLNLGITTWVRVSFKGGDEPGDDYYYIEEIGYAKTDGKWGIALKTTEGFDISDDVPDVETFLFNEAPRALRLKAIEKIPALLKALSDESAKVTKELEAKLTDIQAVAAVVNPQTTKPTKQKSLLDALGKAKVAVVGITPSEEYGKLESAMLNAGLDVTQQVPRGALETIAASAAVAPSWPTGTVVKK
jgi:hypothetical protein